MILVTGAGGQLANEIKVLSGKFRDVQFSFPAKENFDITDASRIESFFNDTPPFAVINCAAYTAVDRAESEREAAFRTNADGPALLAAASARHKARFIHLSTDYVFDGKSETPYKEEDPTNPVNVYGESKLLGEQYCLSENPYSIVIRTSWVFSEFGANFVKTMSRLMKERSSLNVVSDQTGSPTYAADIAAMILHLVFYQQWVPGIFHYCNEGRTNWYEFALEIRQYLQSSCKVIPVGTADYPTAAKRPSFSLLDTGKIKKTYNVTIPGWKESLLRCLSRMSE